MRNRVQNNDLVQTHICKALRIYWIQIQILKSLLSCAKYLKDESYELTIGSELKHGKVDVPWIPVIPPVETIGEMIFLMTLDESNQVQRFHIEYHPISENPVTYTI
jgi:hypothetical protein